MHITLMLSKNLYPVKLNNYQVKETLLEGKNPIRECI